MPKIVCVTPTIRPECHRKFRDEWGGLFEKHGVTLVTVWDGEEPLVEVPGLATFKAGELPVRWSYDANKDLFCRFTDACRNLGFVAAAHLKPDYVLTMDDDCYPPPGGCGYPDPIQAHLDALQRRVPLGWMNTAHQGADYLRGVPYGVRDEAPVMLSHGVWVGVPDFDGETQMRLEREQGGVPSALPYYVGPVPRMALFPLCGMNVMVRAGALPLLYFAPMGKDSGAPDLHRFADIFMGVHLKRLFDRRGWACYTGASTVLHSRASDAARNYTQEGLGRKWLEILTDGNGVWGDDGLSVYWSKYLDKAAKYESLVKGILEGG
jgi:reversibly glycosylated polypeptide/UDP-arabinopyranose mutase